MTGAWSKRAAVAKRVGAQRAQAEENEYRPARKCFIPFRRDRDNLYLDYTRLQQGSREIGMDLGD